MKEWICIILSSLFFINNSNASFKSCGASLWPINLESISQNKQIYTDILILLKPQAKKALALQPQAIEKLASAGKTNIHDLALQQSRQAVKEADAAAILALMYRLTKENIYLEKAKTILITWASTNKPTGNPIDETRLEGLIWAYDLISCDLKESDKKIILAWLDDMTNKKRAWVFGPVTATNNHKVHHLKMLIMLDKILNRSKDWDQDIQQAIALSSININSQTGVSLDYINRTSLYYHNYDLQPWLELSLIANLHLDAVDKAFNFLTTHILSNHIQGEFNHSQAKIDGLRAKGGFAYAKKDGTFDITRATPTIITYYTLRAQAISPTFDNIIAATKNSSWLTFIKARQLIWQTKSPSPQNTIIPKT